jgi:uncharacterized protein YrzB (UPF0473 family)
MGKSDDKTNVCRVLDQKKVSYKTHVCPDAEGLSGDEIAAVLNENPEQAFKTLVTVGKTGKNYVFVVPVNKELDLKKAAKAVGEKSIEMIKSNLECVVSIPQLQVRESVNRINSIQRELTTRMNEDTIRADVEREIQSEQNIVTNSDLENEFERL